MNRARARTLRLFLWATTLTLSAFTASPLWSGALQTYIVLYNSNSVPADAADRIARAGGALVYRYDVIGVAIATSTDDGFAAALSNDGRVEGVSSTAGFGIQSVDATQGAPSDPVVPGPPQPGADNLSGLQWDMVQISAPQARAITGGSASVVAGIVDTGIDYTHPDLAPNIDFSRSVSCVGGVPNTAPAAWMDFQGHGTHVAGTVAAAKNGIGIIGVAPGVRLAAIKAGNDFGFFYPEAVICAFVWAGSHQVDVTNNSYFADPWLFNCRNDTQQRAIWKAEQRAIQYALSHGVTVVTALGNQNLDLAHPAVDNASPSDGPPVAREITNACLSIPAEIPGVIGVSANGHLGFKSYYSNYGVGTTSVVAPGGDRFQLTPAAPNGRVLSTYPSGLVGPFSVHDCSVSPCANYAFLQGTSMASPHVAGVAALVISQFGRMTPGALKVRIERTADPIACPPSPFGIAGFAASCQGGLGNNGFYGRGQVNALAAISK